LFTKKAVAYFTLATLLLALALTFEDWQLAVMVLPVASLFFLTNVWGFPERVLVELGRNILPAESFGDEKILVEAVVENKSGGQLENVEIHEALPGTIKPSKGTNHLHLKLQTHETRRVSFEFDNPGRGRYPIGPLTVRVRDAFGFYLSEKKLDEDILAVMPRPERTRGTELRPRHLGPWPGTIPSRASGMGTEFYSLRGYLPGDDMKRVNWKASARDNRLIVNEMEAERTTDVMLVLDTDVSFLERPEKELFEQSIRAAASMSSLLLRQGNRVGLILQGQERGIVPPGFGKRQERRILYMLAEAKPGRAIIPTSYVITLLARLLLPAKAQMVIISPLLETSIVEGIRQLVMAGYGVMVLCPSQAEPETYTSEAERLAFQITRLERANVLLAVEKTCTLIQWPAGTPLSRRLREVKPIRPRITA
jgi:uncharacterized protein (DUF58 family)